MPSGGLLPKSRAHFAKDHSAINAVVGFRFERGCATDSKMTSMVSFVQRVVESLDKDLPLRQARIREMGIPMKLALPGEALA